MYIRWYRDETIDDEAFLKVVSDAKRIFEKLGRDEIAGGSGEGEARFEENEIRFNARRSLKGLGDGFYLLRKIDTRAGSDWKKDETNDLYPKVFKPKGLYYEVLVRCVLLLAERHIKDGFILEKHDDPEDWKEAYKLADDILNEKSAS